MMSDMSVTKKTIFVILIVACTFEWQVYPISGEQYTPLLKVSTNNVYLTAGMENEIEINLKNLGGFDVYEVSATLSVSTTALGITILDYAQIIYNKIENGSTKTYHPILYIDRTTPLGAYSLTLQVSYLKMYKTGDVQKELSTVQIGIVVNNVMKPEVKLDVGMEGLKLTTGTEGETIIRIENIGEKPVYEVDARIISNSPQIVVLEGARFTHEGLDLGDSVSFESTLGVSRSSPLGVYTLSASVSYEDEDGRDYMETFTLGVTVDSVLVANQTSVILRNYRTMPETINPGDVVELSLELKCLGAGAYDVKASLYFDPLVGISNLSPTLVALGDMEPNELTEASYRLIVDGGINAGQYPSSITLSYIDVDGSPRNLVETATLSIRGIVEFSLINVDPIAVSRGGSTEFEADLLLVGTESVQFVTVEVVEDTSFMRTTESEEYIGAVDPDSPIPFDLEFKVAEESETGYHPLTLKVTYTDDLNQDHESIIELPVTVTESTAKIEPTGGSSGGFWLWLRRLFGLLP